ncbi:MAG: phosphonate C-P lyase system protein PhnH [Rhizobiales bacterium]|nr:phosphonate C-P lyase system protein PhnH [Hyphomicrobiales bacterium]
MLTPGFADLPLQAQSVFRLVLDAMACPGRIKTLGDDAPTAPAPLADATFAVALTLLDFETPIWLDQRLSTPGVLAGLRFHCGCPIVYQPEEAAFALIGDAAHMPPLAAFNRGTPDYPDRAATLLIQTEGLVQGEGWTLSGPGVRNRARLRVLGLSRDMLGQLLENRARFPNGVDLIFAHGRQLACLPRTTELEG